MNERIKELAKQAGLSYLYDYDADGHAMVCSEKDIKKFAELLIRECADVACNYNGGGWVFVSNSILEHFGVEE